MKFYQYIGGELEEGKGRGKCIYNPGTGKEICQLKTADKQQTLSALESAQKAFLTWSALSLTERGNWIHKLKAALLKKEEELVDILSMETGKPLFAASRDYHILIDALDFYWEEAKRLTGISIPDYNSNHATYHLHEYRPIGVVVGHLAWNMPLLNVGAKLGPALASGCTCIIKPSSLTPLSALKVGEIAASIQFPAGVINIVAGPSEEVAAVLNQSPVPRLITLIGSSATGRKMIQESSTSIKTYSLELGGNAPAVVLPDADVEKAANFVASMKMNNCGQVCTSVNRAIVHESVAEEFCNLVQKKFEACKLGWGREDGATMGPLITPEDRNRVMRLVEEAVKQGAKLRCGGNIPEDRPEGNYMMPALLTQVHNSMRVCQEEIFGPVLPVLTYHSPEDAVALANDTRYGLSAYVYTNDMHQAFELAEQLEAGEVIVNVWGGGSPLPYAHGGIKESGVGKDWSSYSLKEYYYVKRITLTP